MSIKPTVQKIIGKQQIDTMPDRDNFDFPKFSSGYIEDLASWVIQRTKQ
jgi:hypothetical protein